VVDEATPTIRGFEGDRIAQVTDKNGKYCTPRDRDKAKLFHVQVEIWGDSLILKVPPVKEEEEEQPLELNLVTAKTTPLTVEVNEAVEKLTLHDYGDEVAAWMEQATGIVGCRLTGVGPDWNRNSRVNPDQGDAIPTEGGVAPVSLADEAPYLLTNQASLDDLNKRLKARGKPPVDMRRFRPSIVIHGLKAWEEDCLKKIRISGVEFWVWQRCGHCVMTTINSIVAPTKRVKKSTKAARALRPPKTKERVNVTRRLCHLCHQPVPSDRLRLLKSGKG
jgi:uncharacterized protein YcbX